MWPEHLEGFALQNESCPQLVAWRAVQCAQPTMGAHMLHGRYASRGQSAEPIGVGPLQLTCRVKPRLVGAYSMDHSRDLQVSQNEG